MEYLHGGKKHRVLVNNEVLLSAGAVKSPQILMVSGIGPKAQLDKFGIQTIQDLPAVGQHMKDHIGLHCRFSMNQSTGVEMDKYTSFVGFLHMRFEYLIKGSGTLVIFQRCYTVIMTSFILGPLAMPPLDYLGFIKSRIVESKVPDLQLYIMAVDPFVEDFPKYPNFGDDVMD